MDIELIMFWAVVVVIAVAVVFIKGGKEDRLAKSGVDKEQMDTIVKNKVKNYEKFTTVFAYWDEETYSGNASRLNIHRTNWSYAMCFNDKEVYLVPLIFGESSISGGDAVHLSVDNLGLVNANKKQVWISFYDKNNEEVATVFVEPELRKENKRYVNLNQNEEFEKFRQWFPNFMDYINNANGSTPTNKILKK